MLFRSLIALFVLVHGLIGSQEIKDSPEVTRAYELDLSNWITFESLDLSELTGVWEIQSNTWQITPVIPGSNFLHVQKGGRVSPAFLLSDSGYNYLILADHASEVGLIPTIFRYHSTVENTLTLESISVDLQTEAYRSIVDLQAWMQSEGAKSLSVIQTFELSRLRN